MSTGDSYSIKTTASSTDYCNPTYYYPYYYTYHITPDDVRKIIKEELKKFFKTEAELDKIRKRLDELEDK